MPGQWKFKNMGNSVQYLNSNNAPISAYLHSDGCIYYLTWITSVSLVRIDPDGTNVILTTNIAVDSGAFYDAVAVPYNNGTSDEVHFVLGRDNNAVLDSGYRMIVLTFDGTPFTPSVTLESSTGLLLSNYDSGDFSYPNRSNNLIPLWIENNTTLSYIKLVSGGSCIMQKYVPAQKNWVTMSTNINLPVWIGNMNINANSTAWCIGNTVFVHGYDDNHGSATWIDAINLNDMSTSTWWGNTYYLGQYMTAGAWIIANNKVYRLGGQPMNDGNNTVIIAEIQPDGSITPYLLPDGRFKSDDTIPNSNLRATTANALNIGGEILFVGCFEGSNVGTIKKFTYVLEDVVGFTADYTPSTSTINLSWSDSVSGEETFYVIEGKINNGAWGPTATLDKDINSYPVTGVDIINNTYSFRIKRGKLVVT